LVVNEKINNLFSVSIQLISEKKYIIMVAEFVVLVNIYDRHHLDQAGILCAKAHCYLIMRGSCANGDGNG